MKEISESTLNFAHEILRITGGTFQGHPLKTAAKTPYIEKFIFRGTLTSGSAVSYL